MPLSVQRYVTGNKYVIACVTCDADIRVPCADGLPAALEKWDGAQGNFNGHREFICRACISEASTGHHAGGWRW
jgi:hypothetical protein